MYGLLCADPVKVLGENRNMLDAAKHGLYYELVEQVCQQQLLTVLRTWTSVDSATQGKIVT